MKSIYDTSTGQSRQISWEDREKINELRSIADNVKTLTSIAIIVLILSILGFIGFLLISLVPIVAF